MGLPLTEREEDHVLYTGMDVMLLGPPALDGPPPVLAASPEFDLSNCAFFSSAMRS